MRSIQILGLRDVELDAVSTQNVPPMFWKSETAQNYTACQTKGNH